MIAAHRSVPIVLLLVGFLRPATPAAAATILVTKTADTADGACDADCSLREAIMLANTDPDHDIVQVPAGHYRLTITGTPEDAGLNGDLDITKATTVVGVGIGASVVDAGEEPGIGQRVFDVVPFGGGFEVAFTGLTITGGWMDNNSVSDTGGGIMIRGGGVDASLVDVAVVDNYVSFSGAGVQVDPSSTLTVRRSTIAENFTTFTAWGAGIMANGISATIADTTIAGNVATDSGGGIAAVDTTLVVRNSTISGNRANNQGGGIYAVSSPTDLRNVTITNNVADADQLLGGDGGGVNALVTPVTLRNSIVAGNQDASAAGPPTPDCVGPLSSAGHNLLGRSDGCSFTATTGDRVGMAGSPIDPLLGPLADNGGPTGTHALAPGSPAIDTGGPDCEATDQRGVTRTGACDMGAYELVLCKGTAVNRIGTEGDDLLVGTSGADGFLAFGGNDTVRGLGGKDAACMGPGKDVAAGGGGKDRLFGEGGKDRLKGQGGNDRMVGGPGKDTCVGGPGKKDRARQCEVTKTVP